MCLHQLHGLALQLWIEGAGETRLRGIALAQRLQQMRRGIGQRARLFDQRLGQRQLQIKLRHRALRGQLSQQPVAPRQQHLARSAR